MSDPYFASVKLLVHFDGTDAATSATDVSPVGRALTFTGNAQLDTAQQKFGSASLLLDGTGDEVSALDSADWHFGSGDFTIECWIRRAAGGQMMIVTQAGTSLSNEGWYMDYTGTNLRFLGRWGTGSSEFVLATGAVTFTDNVWYAVCAERSGDVWRVYADGAMVGKTTESRTLRDVANLLRIGRRDHGTTPLGFNGWIDEVRITKGVARYGSDGGYTPSTVAFVTGGFEIAADAASFSFSGVSTTFRFFLNIFADAASFILSGQGVNLLTSQMKELIADAAAFVFTGVATRLSRAARMSVGATSFVLTGVAAALSVFRGVSAETGVFVLSGLEAAIARARLGTRRIMALAAVNVGSALRGLSSPRRLGKTRETGSSLGSRRSSSPRLLK